MEAHQFVKAAGATTAVEAAVTAAAASAFAHAHVVLPFLSHVQAALLVKLFSPLQLTFQPTSLWTHPIQRVIHNYLEAYCRRKAGPCLEVGAHPRSINENKQVLHRCFLRPTGRDVQRWHACPRRGPANNIRRCLTTGRPPCDLSFCDLGFQGCHFHAETGLALYSLHDMTPAEVASAMAGHGMKQMFAVLHLPPEAMLPEGTYPTEAYTARVVGKRLVVTYAGDTSAGYDHDAKKIRQWIKTTRVGGCCGLVIERVRTIGVHFALCLTRVDIGGPMPYTPYPNHDTIYVRSLFSAAGKPGLFVPWCTSQRSTFHAVPSSIWDRLMLFGATLDDEAFCCSRLMTYLRGISFRVTVGTVVANDGWNADEYALTAVVIAAYLVICHQRWIRTQGIGKGVRRLELEHKRGFLGRLLDWICVNAFGPKDQNIPGRQLEFYRMCYNWVSAGCYVDPRKLCFDKETICDCTPKEGKVKKALKCIARKIPGLCGCAFRDVAEIEEPEDPARPMSPQQRPQRREVQFVDCSGRRRESFLPPRVHTPAGLSDEQLRAVCRTLALWTHFQRRRATNPDAPRRPYEMLWGRGPVEAQQAGKDLPFNIGFEFFFSPFPIAPRRQNMSSNPFLNRDTYTPLSGRSTASLELELELSGLTEGVKPRTPTPLSLDGLQLGPRTPSVPPSPGRGTSPDYSSTPPRPPSGPLEFTARPASGLARPKPSPPMPPLEGDPTDPDFWEPQAAVPRPDRPRTLPLPPTPNEPDPDRIDSGFEEPLSPRNPRPLAVAPRLLRTFADGARVLSGSLFSSDCDWLVNAANSAFLPGGGLCGAFARRFPTAFDQTKFLMIQDGAAYTATPRMIIHGVAPDYRINKSYPELELAYQATTYRRGTAAYPLLGTGIYQVPYALSYRAWIIHHRPGDELYLDDDATRWFLTLPKRSSPASAKCVVTPKTANIANLALAVEARGPFSKFLTGISVPPGTYDYRYTAGVPGSGKSSNILRGDAGVVICPTVNLKSQWQARGFRAYTPHVGLKYARDQMLVIDEAPAIPPHLLLYYLSVARGAAHLLGDPNQIPALDFEHTGLVEPLRLQLKPTEWRTQTHRCPKDVCQLIKPDYPGITTTSRVDRSIYFDQPQEGQILVFTQAAKSMYANAMTVHEAQGATFNTTTLIVTNDSRGLLLSSRAHAIVALTRHTQKCNIIDAPGLLKELGISDAVISNFYLSHPVADASRPAASERSERPLGATDTNMIPASCQFAAFHQLAEELGHRPQDVRAVIPQPPPLEQGKLYLSSELHGREEHISFALTETIHCRLAAPTHRRAVLATLVGRYGKLTKLWDRPVEEVRDQLRKFIPSVAGAQASPLELAEFARAMLDKGQDGSLILELDLRNRETTRITFFQKDCNKFTGG
uniref:Non-structural polyprotein n=1 Tax=Hepevirus sp. TaxID=2055261 RepID=A0A2H4RDQ5_9VIRU|nr:non-structural polyprotein [Hepevirus sp.]